MSNQTYTKSETLKLLKNLGVDNIAALSELANKIGIVSESYSQSDLVKMRDHLTGNTTTQVALSASPQLPNLDVIKPEEAVALSAHSLVEAQKITIQETIAAQTAQDELLGEVSGVKGGLTFMAAHLRGKQSVLNTFMDSTLQGISEELDAIDREVVGLANEAANWLGKSQARQQQTSALLAQFRQRVKSMSNKLS